MVQKVVYTGHTAISPLLDPRFFVVVRVAERLARLALCARRIGAVGGSNSRSKL